MGYAFLGRLLMVCGGSFLVLGAGLFIAGRFQIKVGPLLPGDIFLKRGNATIFFPIVTCLMLSLVVTLLLNLLALMRR